MKYFMQNVTNCATVENPRVVFEVLLYDGGFATAATKRCLHNSPEVSFNDNVFRDCSLFINDSKNIYVFSLYLNNIGFS